MNTALRQLLTRSLSILAACAFVQAAAGGVIFSAGSAVGAPGGPVTVPIQVSGFTDVTSVQFTLQWDAGVLQYSSVGNFGLTGVDAGIFGYKPGTPDRLTFSWDDPDGTGKTASSGTTIFSVNFIGVAEGSSLVSFTDAPTAREVNVLWNPVTFDGGAGTVEVVPEPVNLALGVFGAVLLVSAVFRRRVRRPLPLA